MVWPRRVSWISYVILLLSWCRGVHQYIWSLPVIFSCTLSRRWYRALSPSFVSTCSPPSPSPPARLLWLFVLLFFVLFWCIVFVGSFVFGLDNWFIVATELSPRASVLRVKMRHTFSLPNCFYFLWFLSRALSVSGNKIRFDFFSVFRLLFSFLFLLASFVVDTWPAFLSPLLFGCSLQWERCRHFISFFVSF